MRFETLTLLGQKNSRYIPCLGQHPQFYYLVLDKQQNARSLVLKPFIANCNRGNSRYSQCSVVHWSTNKLHQENQINHAAGNTLFVIKTDSHEVIHLVIYTQEILHLFRTDSHEIVYPVWDREDKNHTLSSGTSPCRPYKGVTSSPPPPPPSPTIPGKNYF